MMHAFLESARQLAAKGDSEHAIETLKRAADQGHASAAIELGYWFLRGSSVGRDLVKAREFFLLAGALGNEDAAALDMAMTANGSWGAADWPAALSILKSLAGTCDWANEDLSLIEAMDIDADGYPKLFPEAIVLDPLLPVIRLPAFLSPAECQHVANRAVGTLSPSVVFEPGSGKPVADRVRTSEGTVIGPAEEDLVLQAIYRRIARATDTQLTQGEPLSVLRYHPGQEYRPHYDAIANAANNRIITVLIYLNDGFTGGRTVFPDLPLAIEPKAGDAIIFHGIDETGELLRRSKHAGEPVAQGVKWMATRWIRSRTFDPWNTSPA